MDKVFNSSFELGLRTLLVLYVMEAQAATIDRIVAYDFLATHSKEFGLSDVNLHGSNNYSFSELAANRVRCNEGIKEFVLNGLLNVVRAENGFAYSLNQTGKNYLKSLKSDYAEQYVDMAMRVNQRYTDNSDEEILQAINKKAVQSLREKL